MKTIRLCLFLSVLSCFNSLFAQEEMGNGMLFTNFDDGILIYKDGTRSSSKFNYNMILEEMLFLNADSTVLALANLSNVLAVIIGDHRFIPTSSGDAFYEEIKAGTNYFFVQRRAKFLSEGKAAGYGGYSQTSSITSINTLYDRSSGLAIKLNPDEKFRMKIEFFFYIKSGNNYKRFFSAKTLGKLFKGQETKIEQFAKEQSIDFSKIADVARIVEYSYSLMNR